MAGSAILGDGLVGSGQHIIGAVNGKRSGLPTGCGRMAVGTGHGQSESLVVRIHGVVVVCRVTVFAFRRGAFVAGRMTCDAGNRCMGPVQGKAGGGMVEGGPQPVVHGVTRLAVGRESGCCMSLGRIVLGQVTTDAFRFCRSGISGMAD